MFELVALIVIGTSIWVYFDARSLGVRKGQLKGLADMGPGSWALVTLLLWIIGFPFYLSKRDLYKQLRGRSLHPHGNASSFPPTVTSSATDELLRLGEMRRQGLLTEEEFSKAKQRLL